jgi:hypothetical protein
VTKGTHTCSFFCDRPGCIEAQRNALRDGMEDLIAAERKAEREACLEICKSHTSVELCIAAIKARRWLNQ